MKRTLTFLTVLTLLTGALFADPVSYLPGGNTINLNAEVKRVEPVFKFYGSMDKDFASAVVEGGGEALNTEKNPATDDIITAYFNITQDNLTRYKGNLLVTFTGTPFKAKVGGIDYGTGLPTLFFIDANDHYFKEGSLKVAYPTGSAYAGHGIGQADLQLNYLKASPIAANTRIMWIGATWSKKESLPAANYEATVSVIIAPTT